MGTTLKTLKAELEPYKDTLVLYHFSEVGRLVDVIDGEDDFYWVYDGAKGLLNSSCCVGWTALKGFLPDAEYERMVHVWNLNNITPAI
jgi:hypothetical protein